MVMDTQPSSPPPQPPPATEELLKQIETLEAGHACLRDQMSKLIVSGGLHRSRRAHSISPQRGPRREEDLVNMWKKGSVSFGHSSSSSRFPTQNRSSAQLPPVKIKPAPGHQFTDDQYLNILQNMGQSVHICNSDTTIIYWNRTAENLYGYTAVEAIGTSICDLLCDPMVFSVARDIIHRCATGESWTGQFPVKNKMGEKFPVLATNTPFYDDDGTLVGVICVSCDSRPFKETKVSASDVPELVKDQSSWRSRSSVTTRLGLDPDQLLQTAIASKITNLASKVGNKVRSKIKTDHKEDGNSCGASPPRGVLAGSPFGIFSVGQPPAIHQRDSSNEGDGKPATHKGLTFKAEAWTGKKSMPWSGKGTKQESAEPQSGRFACPWIQGQKDSDRPHPPAKSEVHSGDDNRHSASEASGSWASFNANSASSASSESSASGSDVNKLDVETVCLDYEILWEDLTIAEQIGQGSCGTVYHGLWNGSDVAVKVFSRQEYSEEVLFSFRQEVSLMKRLRHPNILLFMGAVTSPQRLCLVTEFLPRGSLFELFQRSTFKLDWRRRIHMALDIARGMNYLHSCSPPVIHRDLKSSNLLVDKNWSVKVADFGLSRVKHETYLTTKTGKGTPQWMAPEVLRNEQSDEKSDIYSFGVILWELATQKIPWEHLNAMQAIGAVGFMDQRLHIPGDIDPRWASLIENCWLR